jgi:glycosyltransferase involved in cell wall biosynthesis
MKPIVSVVIPVFNGTKFLDEAVRSIYASCQLPIEVILVDDGSSDGSKEKCRRLEKQHANLRYYDFPVNKGMTRCLNHGISKAKGTYIARINQDDVMVKDRLEKQVAFLETHPEHVAVGSYVTLFTKDNPNFDTIHFPTSDSMLKKNWLMLSPFADPSVMYRKSAYQQTKGYDQAMWPADDVHMWYQLGSLGKLANIPEVLTRVRWHEAAGSIKSHKRQMQKTLEVHLWAAQNIRPATLAERLFWMMEWFAGYLFTPQFNWGVYRLIRKLKQTPPMMEPMVTSKPSTANLVGA